VGKTATKTAKPAKPAKPAKNSTTAAPPMLPEVRFGAYRVTSGDTLIYGFGPRAFDMTPALKEAGAPTDRAHLLMLAGKLKTLAFNRQGLTPRSMNALRIAVGEMQAAQLPLS